ncbi:MAG TPA: FAD-dependent oxidoreductase, partial [Planctomycetota bacterium]|nr:FAD-dependent oxidoreductase [Planctomycetota bacterium]
MTTIQSDVAIIGAGFGGVAAALALTQRGHTVTLTEEFPWIGGQVSSQALCVLDDLDYPSGETVGVTRRYAEFRARTRDFYRTAYKLSSLGRAQLHLCAGNARCSHLTAEPNVAHDCLRAWLQPAIQAGRLKILTGIAPIRAHRQGDRVLSVTCAPVRPGAAPDSQAPATTTLEAKFFLDGTETGDTYPLLSLPYRLGAEAPAEFHEPHAHTQADRTAIQCFTYCAMVEFVPGGKFTSPKPARYEAIRDKAGFYLSGPGSSREEPSYFFKPRILKSGARIVPFWFYRCVVDSANFENVTGRAVINVKCNDFNDAAYLENPARETILENARALTRAYIYWLQTEAPRDEGGFGYPELRPMPEATGTPDGVAMGPYVREGRRLIAERTVTEQDLSADLQPTARARPFADSVGLGGYAIDIHARAGQPGPSIWQPARPYQIPLSALVTPSLSNFAVAGKGLGVTQVANGAYSM